LRKRWPRASATMDLMKGSVRHVPRESRSVPGPVNGAIVVCRPSVTFVVVGLPCAFVYVERIYPPDGSEKKSRNGVTTAMIGGYWRREVGLAALGLREVVLNA